MLQFVAGVSNPRLKFVAASLNHRLKFVDGAPIPRFKGVTARASNPRVEFVTGLDIKPQVKVC